MEMKLVAALLAFTLALVFGGEPDAGYVGPGYPEDCPIRCERIFDPVCAEDDQGKNRTYASKCMIDYINCKEKTNNRYIAEGPCPDDPVIYQDDEAFDKLEKLLN